jgi:hypothetical protein
MFCDDGRFVLGRDPLVGEMYKQVQRARQEAGAVVAMAGWQTGGLSVNKVWCSDNKMGAGSIIQQQPGVMLGWYEMVVYWAGLMISVGGV